MPDNSGPLPGRELVQYTQCSLCVGDPLWGLLFHVGAVVIENSWVVRCFCVGRCRARLHAKNRPAPGPTVARARKQQTRQLFQGNTNRIHTWRVCISYTVLRTPYHGISHRLSIFLADPTSGRKRLQTAFPSDAKRENSLFACAPIFSAHQVIIIHQHYNRGVRRQRRSNTKKREKNFEIDDLKKKGNLPTKEDGTLKR